MGHGELERIIVMISNDMLCTALLNSTPQSMITWSLSVWEYGISISSMRSRWVEVIVGKQSFQYQYIFKHTPSISAEFCLLVDMSVWAGWKFAVFMSQTLWSQIRVVKLSYSTNKKMSLDEMDQSQDWKLCFSVILSQITDNGNAKTHQKLVSRINVANSLCNYVNMTFKSVSSTYEIMRSN